ncbi:hypothetical protein BD410DRAFT_835945 [Rickenella mellea]|uniref:Uncharacterized protein n=1 Tax=Rickenella mellea TaxID=50990 RepID=A0A4Y7QI84_9AGAM|nr:hypothetical protein BD410DRAFT_835945 [Rickenella mellea]
MSSFTSKTLSNGTLSLRFMQRAQSSRVEATQAPVRDDAEWEVAPAVREAWGLSSPNADDTVEHDASYLPFLFGTHDVEPKLKGRRAFNKHGVEVDTIKVEEKVDISADFPAGMRPTSLSGAGGSIYREQKGTSEDASAKTKGTSKGKEKAKPVQVLQMISADADVGVDLRASRAKAQGFMRPAGVDSPSSTAVVKSDGKARKRSNSTHASAVADVNGFADVESKPKKKKKRTSGE